MIKNILTVLLTATALSFGSSVVMASDSQCKGLEQSACTETAGCRWLHLVDLNGAFAGRPVNAEAVEAILAATSVPAQLGGGIRDMATIENWLGRGIARVILGTVAVEDPETFACLKAPVRRVCALQVPIPYSPGLEDHVFPDREKIAAGVKDALRAG